MVLLNASLSAARLGGSWGISTFGMDQLGSEVDHRAINYRCSAEHRFNFSRLKLRIIHSWES